jgi:DNA uptake protein ComE-like DNA-binding protein
MARGHWLDPFARRLLEATGQLPPRPQAGPRLAAAANPPAAPDPLIDPQIERELLALRLRQQPDHRLRSGDEAQHAAALGWRLDVNRASADDWLRLPGIQPGHVDLLLRLQQGGVQLSGLDDLQRLLDLPNSLLAQWEPLLLFRWYGDGLPPAAATHRLVLNRSTAAQLEQQLPQLNAERRARLLRERQRQPFQDLADLQQRLQLPPDLVEDLIGRVRFGQGGAGPQLPRSA